MTAVIPAEIDFEYYFAFFFTLLVVTYSHLGQSEENTENAEVVKW